MKESQKDLAFWASKRDTVFLGSVDEEGFPHTKAMLPPRKQEGLKTFYLTTNTSSRRVAQFRQNPKACLYFCDRSFFQGLQLLGRVEVLEDQASKDLIWRQGDTMYYPLGPTDPDYCVLRFTAHSGRRYGNFHSEDFTIE